MQKIKENSNLYKSYGCYGICKIMTYYKDMRGIRHMRFKNDNDNRYRVNFMRATEELINKMTVTEFIEYLKNNAILEEENYSEYIDGKVIRCKACELKETDKLCKEFLITEDSRLFYWLTPLKKIELVDNEF